MDDLLFLQMKLAVMKATAENIPKEGQHILADYINDNTISAGLHEVFKDTPGYTSDMLEDIVEAYKIYDRQHLAVVNLCDALLGSMYA
jgi:hypothetical protein